MNIKLDAGIEAVIEDIYGLYDSVVYGIDEFVDPGRDSVSVLYARKFSNKYSYTVTFTIDMVWGYVGGDRVMVSLLSRGDVNIYENETLDVVFVATINFSEWK